MPPVFGSIEKATAFLTSFGLYRACVERTQVLMGLQPPDKWIGRVGWDTACGPTARQAFDLALAQWQERHPDEYARAVSEWEARQLGAMTPLAVGRPGGRGGL